MYAENEIPLLHPPKIFLKIQKVYLFQNLGHVLDVSRASRTQITILVAI